MSLKDPVDVYIGARLKAVRDMRQMTLGQVGRELGLTYQQIRKYESGDNRLSASRLYRLCELFAVEPSFFFDGLRPQQAGGNSGTAADPHLAAALGRIVHPDIRFHLEGLINVLDAMDGASQDDASEDEDAKS